MKSTWLPSLVAAVLLVACRTPADDRFVSPAGGNVPPFNSWATAANTLQDAIDAALAGDTIWVTNGLYSSGGKVKGGDLTNRVAIDKAVTVQSVNGAAVTIIQGAWDPSTTNGPLAVRCAWMTNGAVLNGFTLRGGATRNTGGGSTQTQGGAVYGATNPIVANCLLSSNAAYTVGGGAYQVVLSNCTLIGNTTANSGGAARNCTLNGCTLYGNSAGSGGGTYGGALVNCIVTGNSAYSGGGVNSSTLLNCAVLGNSASSSGGGAYSGSLVNCTVSSNVCGTPTVSGVGGGAYSAKLTNCIIFGNQLIGNGSAGSSATNYALSTLSYCCATPFATGEGNFAFDPQLLADDVHIAQTSPCRGAGLASVATGSDIDGQAWGSPPSVGATNGPPLL